MIVKAVKSSASLHHVLEKPLRSVDHWLHIESGHLNNVGNYTFNPHGDHTVVNGTAENIDQCSAGPAQVLLGIPSRKHRTTECASANYWGLDTLLPTRQAI
jgi:hypothetical protein